MNRSHLFVAPLVSLSLLASALEARATDPIAEVRYREGRDAAQAKNWDLACAKFKESHALEPAPGTLLNLADCEENRGHLLAALGYFQSVGPLFRAGDARIEYAKQRSAAVERRIPTLKLRIDPAAPAGTTVERDGSPVDAAMFGVSVRVDTGEHVLIVHAPGRVDARTMLRLSEFEAREVMLAPGAEGHDSAPPSTAGVTEPGKATAAAHETPPAPHGPSRAPAYAALGVGAVGIGVGVVSGIVALGAASTVRTTCPGGVCANQPDQETADNAKSRASSMALVSTIGLGVGIAGAAVGTFLLVKASSQATIAASMGPGTGGVLLRGAF
jgi:hypothetical protein